MQRGNADADGTPREMSWGRGAQDGASGSRLWPTLIILGLVLVILVNLSFIYVAVTGADEIVPSYQTEER